MSDDAPLKSAYELAMERLSAEDRRSGVKKPKPLTRKQKDRIAELRAQTGAKLAEREIMLRKEVAEAGGDPDKLRELEEHSRIDRRRAESALEDAIARVKRGE